MKRDGPGLRSTCFYPDTRGVGGCQYWGITGGLGGRCVVAGESAAGQAGWLLAGLAPGAVVAGYRLETRIGAGGMAVVFRARDERLGRTVALKVLAPSLAGNGEFRERFIRESRAAAAVDHPHIIPVYGAGDADGILYLAMRYVSGGDLRSVMHREGPLPAERQPPGQHRERHAGQRVLVGLDVRPPAGDLLGGGVVDRADELPGPGQPGHGRGPLGEPEVRQVRMIGPPRAHVDEDVGRLHIPVHEPGRVRA